jgi:hypothetical protein
MKIIKFSHQYRKILDSNSNVIGTSKILKVVETATLLQVIPVNIEDLSQSFVDYDTEKGLYKLPTRRGKYMMLIFLKPYNCLVTSLNLFTTLRRWSPEREQDYKNSVGEDFVIELSDGPAEAEEI